MENYQSQISWRSFDGEVSLETVRQIENALGIQFPSDYIDCARLYNGGCPSLKAFDFEGREGAVFNRLLSLHSSRSDFIIKVFHYVRDRLVEGIYPFADDPFGNLLCFDYRKGDNPTIVFWDHEVAFEDPEGALTYVADSFTELLSKLYD
jgi:hypothetical protein